MSKKVFVSEKFLISPGATCYTLCTHVGQVTMMRVELVKQHRTMFRLPGWEPWKVSAPAWKSGCYSRRKMLHEKPYIKGKLFTGGMYAKYIFVTGLGEGQWVEGLDLGLHLGISQDFK